MVRAHAVESKLSCGSKCKGPTNRQAELDEHQRSLVTISAAPPVVNPPRLDNAGGKEKKMILTQKREESVGSVHVERGHSTWSTWEYQCRLIDLLAVPFPVV
ncbi:hypothetical protein R1flu_015224 [Riccia fluitans]|uniref:Uncharacterized protein n=1 Tax=Riccia fluitans TaxID=41844 RepID=A0ABD1YIK9_9MARC